MNRSYSKIRHIREANALLESRTVLKEQMEGAPNHKVGDVLKIKTGPNNSYVVVKITNSTFNEPGNVSYDFKVLKPWNTNKYKVGDKGTFSAYDNEYTIFFNDGSQIDLKFGEIEKLQNFGLKESILEQDGNAMYPGQVDKTTNVQTVVNKVATEGIKNVTTQMMSSPQFKGSYSGYQFGGVFNGVNYQWDCNDIEGMSGIRGLVDGEIISETVDNMFASIKQQLTDGKPGTPSVGFYSKTPGARFFIYTTNDNKVKCKTF